MWVELSSVNSERAPVYPGVDKIAYEPGPRMDDGDPNNATYVRLFLHDGTHVDAPFHFDNEGKKINEIPIEDFIYDAPLVLDIPKQRGELVTRADLEPHMEALRKADLVLFHTGFGANRDNEAVYQDEFPAIDVEAAQLLRDELLNVKGIGIDTLSIESVHAPENGFPVHRALLHHAVSNNRTLLIYENVVTDDLAGKKVEEVYALPIRFAGLEAAPVSMIARVE